MKTTIDLPDELVRRLKLRALNRKQKLKDAVADLLRAGLSAPAPAPVNEPAVISKDKKTGLPVIRCRRAAPRGKELTPRRVADILNDQEATWMRESA